MNGSIRMAMVLLLGAGSAVGAGCGLRQGYAPAAVPVYSGVPAAAAPAVAGDSLTVVCWNIRYGENTDLALAEIRAHPRLAAADLVLLQEMDREGTAALAASLGMHFVYAPASVATHHRRLFGNAVLARRPIVAHRALLLPHRTPLTGHRRVAVAADVDLGGGLLLRVVSAHTATVVVDQARRLEQAAAVLDSLGGGGPALVGGDFNTVSAWEVTQLRRLARRRGFALLRLPPGPTIANRLKKLPGSTPVLDHLLLRGLAAGSRGVVRGAAASDHYPVWAVIARPAAPNDR